VGFGHFRLPSWDLRDVRISEVEREVEGTYSGCIAAVAQAGDDTSDDQVGEGGGAGLEDGTNTHNASTEHNHPLATERVSNPYSDNSAEETSKSVRRHGDTCVRNL
jgi:hypothetical protein